MDGSRIRSGGLGAWGLGLMGLWAYGLRDLGAQGLRGLGNEGVVREVAFWLRSGAHRLRNGVFYGEFDGCRQGEMMRFLLKWGRWDNKGCYIWAARGAKGTKGSC